MAIQETNKNLLFGGGYISPWWTKEDLDLPYIHEPFNNPDDLAKWQALGYTQTRFTGDLYDMRFPEPSWIDGFRKHFQWDHWSWSVYRMPPGTVLPNHSDTYARFKQIHNLPEDTTVKRAVVFLEDWQSGHYFEINGRPMQQLNSRRPEPRMWFAGTWIAWSNDTPHLAANMGMTNRYTLQITGI